MESQQTSRALGWFSIGLGATEVFAPNLISRLAGMEKQPALVRGFGLREIGTGMAILSQPQSPTWMWARVGGDFLDLTALASNARRWNRVALAGAATLGITALDVAAAQKLGSQAKNGAAAGGATEVQRTISIGKSAEELYRVWREPQALPTLMKDFAEVTLLDADRARWTVHAPLGRTLEWETHIVEDRPGELVRWESLPEASVPNQGSISFRPAPDGWGTEATLRFCFEPPPGPLGGVVALLPDAVPSIAIGTALRRFKSLAETGEIPTLEHNPSARGRGDTV